MQPDSESTVEPLKWNDYFVANFWNYYATYRPNDYFTRQFGDRIVKATARFIDRGATICDFGCGAGYLLEKLVRNFKAAGCDFSPSNVEATKARLGNAPNLLGVYLSTDAALPAKSFDTVYLVETVEHLLEPQVLPTMEAVARVLKPRGKIVVTTPNSEDLAASTVYCPSCQHTFHRWQHVRSFSEAELNVFMQRAGFEPIRIFTTDFGANGPIQRLKAVIRPLIGRRNPHLVYVGCKIE